MILDYEVIKLHNFVVQSYNELLILDCEAIECASNQGDHKIAFTIAVCVVLLPLCCITYSSQSF